ncbi:MAG: CbtA family protein [Nitrososphaera sp.]
MRSCKMGAGRIFALSIAAGLLAGAVLVAMNLLVVNPYIEPMADLYFDLLLEEGMMDEDEFDAMLQSLYTWQVAFPLAIGPAAGALVAGAYLKIRKDAFKVALAVAGAAWLSLYVMPVLKYPYSPDALFIPEAAGAYTTIFASYSAASGLAALGSAFALAKTGRKNWHIGAAGVYLAIVAGLFFAFPSYPETEIVPFSMLGAWRSASAAAMTAFWFTLGIVAGVLLERKNGAGRGI